MMLVDSHCHLDRLDLAPFDGGLAGVLTAAKAQGVTRLLSVATDLESVPALARLTEPYPHIALSIGVHPGEDGGRAPTVAELAILGQESRVVAIGETGLDYHYGADYAPPPAGLVPPPHRRRPPTGQAADRSYPRRRR
jgi:TatD DNase family protein